MFQVKLIILLLFLYNINTVNCVRGPPILNLSEDGGPLEQPDSPSGHLRTPTITRSRSHSGVISGAVEDMNNKEASRRAPILTTPSISTQTRSSTGTRKDVERPSKSMQKIDQLRLGVIIPQFQETFDKIRDVAQMATEKKRNNKEKLYLLSNQQRPKYTKKIKEKLDNYTRMKIGAIHITNGIKRLSDLSRPGLPDYGKVRNPTSGPV